MRTKDAYFAAVAVLLALAVGSAAVAYKVIIAPARDFDALVDVGLTQAELIERVDDPPAKLAAGETIPAWGNAPKRIADREAWVYFVYPESQHRFVISFDGEKVVNVEHGEKVVNVEHDRN
jgi:hypothetical protein